tara:strand:- start:2574 stop:3416 length:843 start_codon:yes stop_codon:yes gene_type:complete
MSETEHAITPRSRLLEIHPLNNDPIYTINSINNKLRRILQKKKSKWLINQEIVDVLEEFEDFNLTKFLKQMKHLLQNYTIKEMENNMSPEVSPPTLLEIADRKIRNSKPSELGKSREELNEIMESINLPPVYKEDNIIRYKINALSELKSVFSSIKYSLWRIHLDKFNGPIKSGIYMKKNDNGKYNIICKSFEYHLGEIEQTVYVDLEEDFSNIDADLFFENIMTFVDTVGEKMDAYVSDDEGYGGKRKSKNKSKKSKRKTNKKKSMKKRKMKKTKKSKK